MAFATVSQTNCFELAPSGACTIGEQIAADAARRRATRATKNCILVVFFKVYGKSVSLLGWVGLRYVD